MLCLGFCMASERGRLFLISLHPDLQVMARWHRLYSQPGHNWHLAKEWMDMLSCVALSLLDESW